MEKVTEKVPDSSATLTSGVNDENTCPAISPVGTLTKDMLATAPAGENPIPTPTDAPTSEANARTTAKGRTIDLSIY